MHELVITDPEVRLGLEKETLVLTKAGHTFQRNRLQALRQVVLLGPIDISAAALRALLRRRIDVLMLTSDGDYLGRMVAPGLGQGLLRLAQYRHCADPVQALATAQRLIQGKIENQRKLLLRMQRDLQNESVAQSLTQMRLLASKIATTENLASLLGYEGRSAAYYFQAFPQLIRVPGFAMQGRSKRPPRDAPNALLSFGYAILTGIMESLVLQVGLDPWLGCLHQARPGLAALVLDLIEEFRPVVVDPVVLRLLNRGQMSPADFFHPDLQRQAEAILWSEEEPGLPTAEELAPAEADPRPAVYLARTGHQIFFRAFYQRLRERLEYPPQQRQLLLREIMRQQVYHFARVVQGEDPHYQAFVPR
jgi:CRISPR-associated protein Cas1